jgi:hypothetical protein
VRGRCKIGGTCLIKLAGAHSFSVMTNVGQSRPPKYCPDRHGGRCTVQCPERWARRGRLALGARRFCLGFSLGMSSGCRRFADNALQTQRRLTDSLSTFLLLYLRYHIPLHGCPRLHAGHRGTFRDRAGHPPILDGERVTRGRAGLECTGTDRTSYCFC